MSNQDGHRSELPVPKNAQQLQVDPIYERAFSNLKGLITEHHTPIEIHEALSEMKRCMFHSVLNRDFQFEGLETKTYQVLLELDNAIGIGILIEESKQFRALGM
jgi:hypothetical protein